MSELKAISTDKAPAAIGPYSQAIESDGLIFVSGQLGLDPISGELAETFEAQCRLSLGNLKGIVEAAGSSLSKVIAVDVFLTDMGRFAELNGIYAEFFQNHKPARAAIEVGGLPKGGMVEIKCVAKKS